MGVIVVGPWLALRLGLDAVLGSLLLLLHLLLAWRLLVGLCGLHLAVAAGAVWPIQLLLHLLVLPVAVRLLLLPLLLGCLWLGLLRLAHAVRLLLRRVAAGCLVQHAAVNLLILLRRIGWAGLVGQVVGTLLVHYVTADDVLGSARLHVQDGGHFLVAWLPADGRLHGLLLICKCAAVDLVGQLLVCLICKGGLCRVRSAVLHGRVIRRGKDLIIDKMLAFEECLEFLLEELALL